MERRKRLPDLPAPRGSLMAAVAGYLETCRVLGYSENTLYGRRYPLYHFCAFAYERGVMKPGEVTSPMLTRYQQKLYHSRKKDGVPVSFVTQSSHLTALKMFFKWLSKQGHIRHNPAADMEMPKVGQRLPRATLTVTEVETLLALPDLQTPVGLRDRAILEVFYSTAMRRGELARLHLSDLDFERGLCLIREGKGKKDRYVPIGERALLWVKKYLADGRPHLCRGQEEKDLFLSKDGRSLCRATITRNLRLYFVAAGFEKKGPCHIFRHSAATLMLEGGADIRYIQQMLGHSSLTSTQIYTHVSVQKLKDVHTRTHPAKAEAHAASDLRKEMPGASQP